MSSPAGSGIELPVVTGDHVRAALHEARTDQDAFRVRERTWVEDNKRAFSLLIEDAFTFAIRAPKGGPERAHPMLAGIMLGHRAVRLACEESTALYESGYKNYQRLVTEPRPFTGIQWDKPAVLDTIFEGNDDLVAALLEVNHSDARDGAAFTVGHFTLATIPVLPPETVTNAETTRANR